MRIQTSTLLLGAVIVVGLLLPAAATAGTARLAMVKRAALTPAYSDGSRWAAYQSTSGATRVFDDATGRRSWVTTPPNHVLTDVGGGQLLWVGPPPAGVSPGFQSVVLFDLAARRFHVPAGWEDFIGTRGDLVQDGRSLQMLTVGSVGIAGTIAGSHSKSPVAYNWKTGAFTSADAIVPPAGIFTDTSAPSLQRRLCSPLRQFRFDFRPWVDEVRDSYYLPFAYAKPWALRSAGPRGQTLVLQRCGTSRTVVLTRRCPVQSAPCGQQQLGAEWATWEEPRVEEGSDAVPTTKPSRIVAYRLRTHRRRTWMTLTPEPIGRTTAVVRHTRARVLVSIVRRTSADARTYTIQSAKLPRG